VEGTQEISKKVGQAEFIPIPDLDKMRVGHAGLYEPDDANVDIDSADVDVNAITADIPIGVKGGIIVLNVETGIKKFAKDIIAEKKATKEYQHLPYSITGLFVHYFVKGIEEDFNRTFTKTPLSISRSGYIGSGSSSTSKYEVAKEKGKRVLSKKEKNELIAQLSYPYYENDIIKGIITEEEAYKSMMDAAKKKRELEELGYFISPNKTQGVSLFDWKKAVSDANSNEDAIKIYTTNFVEVVIPNIVDNFYHISGQTRANKLAKELYKSPLSLTREVLEVCSPKEVKEYGGMEAGAEPISTINDVLTELKKRFEDKITKIEKEFIINGLHLTKIKKSGMMKPRQVCFDCKSKKDGSTHLFLLDDTGSVLHLQ
jgi:hypothetical protein